jgi:hypothetical protein
MLLQLFPLGVIFTLLASWHTGGVYLVSVYRARSGNMHRAVGQDFVLNVDDVLYFTSLVHEFAKFASDHGLEIITHEVDLMTPSEEQNNVDAVSSIHNNDPQDVMQTSVKFATTSQIAGDEVKDIEAPDGKKKFRDAARRRSTLFLNEKELKLQAIHKLIGTSHRVKTA